MTFYGHDSDVEELHGMLLKMKCHVWFFIKIIFADEEIKERKCNHKKDKCGCYLALVEEKSLSDYRLKKYEEKQHIFIETLQKAVLQIIGMTTDDALVIELTKLGMCIVILSHDILYNHNNNV